MNYEEWINRERRVRIKLLKDSRLIWGTEIYRICRDCGEICLCHEDMCPNCNSKEINQRRLDTAEVLEGRRIRCKFRFDHLI